MGRILAAFATLLILVIGAAFIVPAFMDWDQYRDVIEQAASSAAGRPVSTKGAIEIRLLPEPIIRLAHINIGKDAKRPDLSADQVDIALSLQALLGGRIEADSVNLSKPQLRLDLSRAAYARSASWAQAGVVSMSSSVKNLTLQDGRISVSGVALDGGKEIVLEKVNGSIAAPTGDSYRFIGGFSRQNQAYDLKFLATPEGAGGYRLNGSMGGAGSKATIQADGFLTTSESPVFDGIVTATSFVHAGPDATELQMKGTAKADIEGVALSDLTATLDPQNRPQILTGSAWFAFASNSASLTLQAKALDADRLIAKPGAQAAAPAAPIDTPSGDWSSFRDAAGQLIWTYPSTVVRVSVASDQLQLNGELLESVQVDATRAGERWVFEKLLALLPGDTAVKVVGSITKLGGASEISGVVSVDGKNIGRLARWVAPNLQEAKSLPSRPFSLTASANLADDSTAFEGVTGNIAGTPFNASLHFDKAPVRKLSVSLSGRSFDLTGFEADGASDAGLSLDVLNSGSQGGVSKAIALAGKYFGAIEAADVDLTVDAIKTNKLDAKNLTARVKYAPGALSISKINLETADGLLVRGEGTLPLKEGGEGKFEGRIEASKPEAVRQALNVYGVDFDSLGGRRAEDFAPAALSVSYGANPAASGVAGQINGTLGLTKVAAAGQLDGAIADWKTAPLSFQLDATSPDGARLAAQLLSATPLPSGAGQNSAPGTLTLRLKGQGAKFDSSATLKTASLQIQADGAAGISGSKKTFRGTLSASAQSPETFLPDAALALLGGQRGSSLRVDASVSAEADRLSVSNLKAVSNGNTVSGQISLDMSEPVYKLDGDLKADRFSAPALASYFLVPAPADPLKSAIAIANGSPVPIWSNQPFALTAFQSLSGKLALAANTLKLSDTVSLTNADALLRFQPKRIDIQQVEGQLGGGDAQAAGALTLDGPNVSLNGKISLSNLDMSAIASDGKPSVMAGKAAVLASVSGQALSPQGLISVLRGRGRISMSDGQINRLSPAPVQKVADELLMVQPAPAEEAISKRVMDAVQSADFKFKRLKIPLLIRDGVVEIRRASFRNKDGTIRLEAYLDLQRMQIDSTWQMGVGSDRRAKWPPVKITAAGPAAAIGTLPRTLAAEDLARNILVRRMEGDIKKLEGLNKPPSPWTTMQEATKRQPPRRQVPERAPPATQGGFDAGAPNAAVAGKQPPLTAKPAFEKRMQEILQSQEAGNDDAKQRKAP